jgi:hypothetical protein
MECAHSAGSKLHRPAIQSLKLIEKTVQDHSNLLPPVLDRLLGESGDFAFDERIKGPAESPRTIEKILKSATSKDAEAVIQVLKRCAVQAANGYVACAYFT